MPTDPIRMRPGEDGRLIVHVPYSPDHVTKIKTVVGRRWHQLEEHWTMPQTNGAITHLLTLFAGEPTEVHPSLDAMPAPQHEKPFPESHSAMLVHLCAALRACHYARRTEQAYGQWVTRFNHFHHGRHPTKMAELGINIFLTHLAIREKVSASTQTQALAALLFFYRVK